MEKNLSAQVLSEIIHFNKYAQFIESEQRRETWEESVFRNRDMHMKKFPFIKEEISQVYKDFVLTKKVLPSMRSMQFAGRAVELNHSRVYNCCFLPVDHWKAFPEIMFLLLGGSGVGYSVQNLHIDKIPSVRRPEKRQRYIVQDTIIGWADAVKALVRAYLDGKYLPIFDYSDIRPKGALLKTSGGKAPGPEPLKSSLTKIYDIFDRKQNGERLNSLEVHDIICHIADAVYAGGIRRAAMIALFNMDDELMLKCKSNFKVNVLEEAPLNGKHFQVRVETLWKDKEYELIISRDDHNILKETGRLPWWYFEPQRGRSNNSAMFIRHKAKKKDFLKFWSMVEENKSGEPGIYFSNNADWGTNPCFSADTQVAVADGRNAVTIKQLAEESQGEIKFPVYSGKKKTQSGWKAEIKNAVAFKTGTKSVIKLVLNNGDKITCTPEHKLALPDGSYVKAKDSKGLILSNFFTSNEKYRTINSVTNGYAKQSRMLWEFNNGSKPEGHAIDHKDGNRFNDSINNLQLLKIDEHDKKSSKEHRGKNNQIYNTKFGADSVGIGKTKKIITLIFENNEDITPETFKKYGDKIYPGVKTDYGTVVGKAPSFDTVLSYMKEYKINYFSDFLRQETKNLSYLTENVYVEKIVDENKTEDVYDLTVEDNHNFYIITKSFDEKHLETRGILVHNCVEIGLRPFQFCNLTEINAATIEDQKDLEERAKAAAFLGTLQAGYTDFHYIRDVWKETTERDALLGVSITGVASLDYTKFDWELAAKAAMEMNRSVSDELGIKPAARVTCIKPAGTTSLILGCSSGVHAWYNDYYIRRMKVKKNENIYTYLKENLPDLVEDDLLNPKEDAFVCVPMAAPKGSVIAPAEDTMNFLERVNFFNKNWVKPGHVKGDNSHNVSATVYVKDDEWEKVGEWMWENRKEFNGLSVLPFSGGTYRQAPHEGIAAETYMEMSTHLKAIDVSNVKENQDNTTRAQELACAGGVCEIEL